MEEGKYSYAAIEPSVSVVKKCAGQVRWREGRLEQLWILTEYTGASPSGQREEWEPVPGSW